VQPTLQIITPHANNPPLLCHAELIKGWVREKKMKLINETNPSLKFLNEELFGSWPPKEIESRL
jgi:predicted GIY-YIG superfamily endonuclease